MRWWLILLFVVVAVAVFRYRRRHPVSTPAVPDADRSAAGSAAAPTGAKTARFQWGDAVTVSAAEGGASHPGARAMVVEVADAQRLTYRVEFADGTNEVLPESALQPTEHSAD